MPPSSFTYNFDQMLSTTLMNMKDTLTDNIYNAIPLYWWIHRKDHKKTEDGGERIVLPLQYGKNTTIKSMASSYSIVDTTPQDTITSCYWLWKEISGSITISHGEQRKNSGKHKIIDLLQSKVDEAVLSFQEKLTEQVLAIATSSPASDLDPIPLLIQKTPTNASTVGGIAQATYAWWQNKAKSSTATTWAGLINEMTNLYNTCAKGAGQGKRDFPDLILCDQQYHETTEAAYRNKLTIYDTQAADLGFGGLKFKGSTLLWDEYVPDMSGTTSVKADTVDSYTRTYLTAFFINSKYIWLVVEKQGDLDVGPFIQPENQKAKTAIIYFMGNLCCNNRRKQGLHHTVLSTLAS
jgi:hypothetical protein